MLWRRQSLCIGYSADLLWILSRSRWPSTPWQDRRRTLSVLKKTPNNDFLFPFHHHTARGKKLLGVIPERRPSMEWRHACAGGHQDHKQEKDGAHEYAWKDQTGDPDLAVPHSVVPISAISASPDQLFLDLSPLLRFLTHPHVIRLYELLDTPSDIFMVGELRTSQN